MGRNPRPSLVLGVIPTWFLGALGYVLAVGLVGITTKLSLRYVSWPVLLFSSTLSYLILTTAVGIKRGFAIPSIAASWLAPVLITGILISVSFVFFMLALEDGEVSQVVPITATYPLVTALVASVFLSESLEPTRVAGIVLIVVGAILVAR